MIFLIVGAGPSGLATAICRQAARLDYVIVEKGVLVNSIFNFPMHMVFFTTPELLEIGGLPLVTPYDKPTRLEALRYYRRVVDTYDLQISFHEAVTCDRARRRTACSSSRRRATAGVTRVREARAVVLAIGYYDLPNYLGIPGEDLPHVSHYYTDAHPYYRRRVVVVGGKNSAARSVPRAVSRRRARDARAPPRRRSATRSNTGCGPTSRTASRKGSVHGALRTRACVEITPTARRHRAGRAREELPAEGVFLLTGYHPDADLMRSAGIDVRSPRRWRRTLNMETFETNVPNLFIAGGAMAGKQTGQHLHRERPFPRREDHRRARGAAQGGGRAG